MRSHGPHGAKYGPGLGPPSRVLVQEPNAVAIRSPLPPDALAARLSRSSTSVAAMPRPGPGYVECPCTHMLGAAVPPPFSFLATTEHTRPLWPRVAEHPRTYAPSTTRAGDQRALPLPRRCPRPPPQSLAAANRDPRARMCRN